MNVKILMVDSFMATPSKYDHRRSQFSDKDLRQVPILRVFGINESGSTACVLLHQVSIIIMNGILLLIQLYPYFYIEYQGALNEGTT